MDNAKIEETLLELKQLFDNYNVTIVTAQQPPRPDDGYHEPPIRSNSDIIIIDHFNLIE